MTKGKTYLREDQGTPLRDKAILRIILRFAKPYQSKLIVALIALLAAQFLPFFFPHLLGKLIDGPITHGQYEGVWYTLSLYLGLVLIQAGATFTSSALSRTLAFEIIHDLRVALFQKLSELRMPFFHKNPIGRLMTRVTSDVDSLLNLFSEGLLDLIGLILMLIFALVFMLGKNVEMGIATLSVLPFMVILTMTFRVKVRDINRIIREKLAKFNSTLQENLTGIRIVQIFFRQQSRMETFSNHNADYRDAYLKNVRYYSWFFPGVNGLSDLSLALCYGTGAWLITSGSGTTVGDLVAFSWYATMFHRPLREISDKITQLQSSLAAGERVVALLDENEVEEYGDRKLPIGALGVEFHNVSFYYRPEQPILHQVSLSIKPGQTLAIVGATGAGKSTLFHLINRFYTAQEGQVLLGGEEISQIQNSELRTRVGLVSQDTYMIEDTLLQNLILGAPYDAERLQQALKYSRLEKVLQQLEHGLDTPIAEGGRNLSAGQRQLIAFARALYRNPSLLLLDEATSAIDSETEALIQEALPDLLQGRSAILIAHRLSTVVGADQIAVLHHGQIAEIGSHKELLEKGGLYAKLVELNKKSSQESLQTALNQL